jgi:hypothetical protein
VRSGTACARDHNRNATTVRFGGEVIKELIA